MSLRLNAKFRWVFERDRVVDRMERKERQVLFRASGYGLTTMRNLMGRKRKKISQAGDPPAPHGQQNLKKRSRFSVEGKSAVIGPYLFRPPKTQVFSSKPGPELADQGGTATQKRKGNRKRRKRSRYRARPYTAESLRRTIPKLNEFMKTIDL